MDRTLLLRGPSRPTDLIVEIGAGYNPIAPKRDGWRTHVVDHASRQDLRAKYAGAAVDVSLIEEVDTIWQDGPLHEAVPESIVGRVNTVIASHVLEHFPDLIGFFQSADRLVATDGLLSVALPDRRYCFDCLRPWTTTGDLLDAYQRKLSRHSVKTAFDHMAYSAIVSGQLAWGPYPVEQPHLLDSFAAAADTAAIHLQGADRGYQDYHAWQFSPAGFELALLELRALGLTNWWIADIQGPLNFEFFAQMRHSERVADVTSDGFQARRQELLLRQIAEGREQAEFLTGGRAELRSSLWGTVRQRLKRI